MRKTISSFLAVVGLTIVAVAPVQSRAANLTTLVSFCALPNCADGLRPYAGVIADASGNLLGTTLGTVFEIAKTKGGYASTPTTLVSFPDGVSVFAGLVADANGNLFGAAEDGYGTVFEIAKTPSGYASTPATLSSFNGTDGANPAGSLTIDANGNLFGITVMGGASAACAEGCGTVFEIVKGASGYANIPTTLVSFDGSDGAYPGASLIIDANGNLLGTADFGGGGGTTDGVNGGGTVFEIAKGASGYASSPTVLYSFCPLPPCSDGTLPRAGLIADARGNLFGTTEFGGANDQGTVFEIAKTPSGYASTPTILVSFNGSDGAFPYASLIIDADGNLFGTTAGGGASAACAEGCGTVFEIAKTAGGYPSSPTVLYSFCAKKNCTDGAFPFAGLIADASGNLFGTTELGGSGDNCFTEPKGCGTVFEITGSGFVPGPLFAGTPGAANCHGQSVSALARQFGGLNNAAAALGYPSVDPLQNAIIEFCEG